jgi:hypothetical protein
VISRWFSEMFQTVAASPLLIGLTIAFFITASIVTFCKRYDQAIKRGDLPPDEPRLPQWVSILFIIEIVIKIAIFVLNWRYGIFVYIVGFVLAVSPVLEMIGNVLMAPFKTKRKTVASPSETTAPSE